MLEMLCGYHLSKIALCVRISIRGGVCSRDGQIMERKSSDHGIVGWRWLFPFDIRLLCGRPVDEEFF